MNRLLLVVLLLHLPVHAVEQRIECPARYPAYDILLRENGQWETGLVPANIPLIGGGMYVGPLSRRGELRGSERRVKGGFVTRFGFDQDQHPSSKWFVCYYGHVQLARRVTDSTTACELTHEEKKFPKEPNVRLSCR